MIVNLLPDHEGRPGPIFEYFVRWCDAQAYIKGTAVEIVSHYKYLGAILENKLSFEKNSGAICKKANKSLFYLKKLRYLMWIKKLLKLFYSSFF